MADRTPATKPAAKSAAKTAAKSAAKSAAKPAATRASKPAAKRATKPAADAGGFSAEEREAMRERARETRAAKKPRGGATRAADEEREVLDRIAAMEPDDRALGERLHALVRASAPTLAPRLWYGMPAWARDGTVVCFFQAARKFKTRYATLGFSDAAALDDGRVWPTAFALTTLSADDEVRIGALLRRAVARREHPPAEG